MRTKFRRSIRWRYALIFAGVMAAIIIAIWILISVFLENYYYRNQQRSMEDARTRFQEIWLDQNMDWTERSTEITDLCEKYNMTFLMLLTNGEFSYAYSSDTSMLKEHLYLYIYDSADAYSNIEVLNENSNYTLWRYRETGYDREYLECVGYFFVGNEYQPYIMSFPLASIEESVNIARQYFLYVGILGIIVSAVIAFFVTRRITKPILQLSEISERMGRLDFNARYEGKEKDEIGILGENINLLSARLEETISELKSANLELQKDIEKKTEIDEKQREFFSNVSHELKSPIALIEGYAEGLPEVAQDPESCAFYCDVIRDEAEKMNTLVKQLMTLTQLEEHEEKMEVTRFNITEMIREQLHSSEVLFKQNQAVVSFYAESDLYVWGDSFEINEVLNNYLTNAIHHLSGEKKIIVSQEVTSDNKTVKILVHNSGDPIPEEDLKNVWDKFYKVDKAHSREYGGSGIGLSIVKAIMDELQQEYGVYNETDGVTFYFTLEKA